MKVPEPQRMTSGNYFIRMRLGGQNVNVTAATISECKKQAALIKAEHLNGKKATSPSSVTLYDAIEHYINDRVNVLSPSTIRGYKTIQRAYFPTVINKKLSAINNWQSIVNALAKKYSAKTVKNTWRFIGSVLRDNDIDVPKLVLPQVVPNDLPWLEPEQVQQFVKAVKDSPCEISALLALHSLRRSEMLALTLNDIDFKNEVIHVCGSSVFDENCKLVDKPTNKNISSRRDIPIMIPRLLELLKDCEPGKVIRFAPNTIWEQINRVCEKNDLPLVGIHGLRRSFASLGYYLKLPERTIMELGGWANPQTVHKVYIKLSQRDRNSSTNAFKEFFKNAN